jgi:hypothetical protein
MSDPPFNDIVAAVLTDADSPHVVVSPVVWLPKPDGTKRWSFYIASSEAGRGFRSFGIDCEDQETADAVRSSIYFALRAHAGRHWARPRPARLRR